MRLQRDAKTWRDSYRTGNHAPYLPSSKRSPTHYGNLGLYREMSDVLDYLDSPTDTKETEALHDLSDARKL